MAVNHETIKKRRLVKMPVGEGKLYSRFYRDSAVMDFLGKTCMFSRARAKAATQDQSQPLKCWSCGCSSGEEAYTVALLWSQLLAEHFEFPLQIVGTDVCEKQVELAVRGEYNAAGLDNLPRGWKEALMTNTTLVTGEGEEVEIIVFESGLDQEHPPGIDAACGVYVQASCDAPLKVRQAFDQMGKGTVIEVKKSTGKCRVVHEKNGEVGTYSIGYKAAYDLAEAKYSVRQNLRQHVRFECQDVREAMPEDGPFDLILCRYSCFLYLPRGDTWNVLCKIVREKLTPGGYLVIGEREVLPKGFESLGIVQNTECPSVFQKVGDECRTVYAPLRASKLVRPSTAHVIPCARPSTAVSAAETKTSTTTTRIRRPFSAKVGGGCKIGGPADPVSFETLDQLLMSQGRKTASDVLRPPPWEACKKDYYNEVTPKQRARQAREYEERQGKLESKTCERSSAVQRMTRSVVRRAIYSDQIIKHLAEEREKEERLNANRNKTITETRLLSFVERMSRDMKQREERMMEMGWQPGPGGDARESRGERKRPGSGRARQRPATAPARGRGIASSSSNTEAVKRVSVRGS